MTKYSNTHTQSTHHVHGLKILQLIAHNTLQASHVTDNNENSIHNIATNFMEYNHSVVLQHEER